MVDSAHFIVTLARDPRTDLDRVFKHVPQYLSEGKPIDVAPRIRQLAHFAQLNLFVRVRHVHMRPNLGATGSAG